ncbi:MAG: FtsX-like permease family protein [Candidatus Staskawiczbacteria bacterium]|nr:FtsX-like permease family protein [Candidatus Staskawiczbacteria bacterium]
MQEKIDITAYFKEAATEEDILKVRDGILNLSPEIKNVKVVFKEEAMRIFVEKHKNEEVFLKALEEVGTNPFFNSLNIQTDADPAQYEEISNILETGEFSSFIEKVDFSQKKTTIEKIFSITSNIYKLGLILSLISVIIAALVVFSLIKLAIDNSREEISTMRMVGASNWFIRGPFIVQGAIYGFLAFIICLVISALSAYLLSPKIGIVLPGFNMFDYFLRNLFFFALMQLVFGIGLGMISSFIVVRRYLKN